MGLKEFMKKNRVEEGQLVTVTDGERKYTGNVLPASPLDNDILRLKLKSGYNIGIKVSPKTRAEKLGGMSKVGKAKKNMMAQNPALPKIAILHIGGTIASRVDYRTGAVTAGFEPEDLLEMFPELMQIASFTTKKIAQIASENMRIEHYTLIANEIAKAAKDTSLKGIILPHGTDTMAYTSAALAFMLENIQIPVILVGAQRSSDRASSDAAMNLVCAAQFITKTDFVGVGICMHESISDENCVILPPCKTRKLHASRRDAFRAVNDTPIARINFEKGTVDFLKDYARKDPAKKLVLMPKIESKVGLIKTHTNMHPEQFEYFLKGRFKGLVIEGTGLGHMEIGVSDELSKPNEKLYRSIKKICKSGTIVVMTSQTIFGRVQMHVYSPGTDLTNIGVIPGEDMLPETAFIKLCWLLGNYKPAEAKELIAKNLRGEISAFTRYDG